MSSSSADHGPAAMPPNPPVATGGFHVGNILLMLFLGFLLVGVPVYLILPRMGQAREASRRNECMNNMRSVAIAVQNHESAQKRYPVASSGASDLRLAQTAGGHGDAPAASDDAFSWLFHLQPYFECDPLYTEMNQSLARDASRTGPFDADFVDGADAAYARREHDFLRCPSYSGPLTTRLDGVEAAISNYVATVATDLAAGKEATWKNTNNWENGGLPSACWSTKDSHVTALTERTCMDKGIRLKNLGDGISRTVIATESCEEKFNAWISGACMWVVAATPNSLAADGAAIGRSPQISFIAMLRGATQLEDDGEGLALNYGSFSPAVLTTDKYLSASDWATAQDRTWGPSSEHAGGIVVHVYADAHVQAISTDIDPTAHLRRITRSDGDVGCIESLE